MSPSLFIECSIKSFRGLEIEILPSSLPMAAGLGSSASFSVAAVASLYTILIFKGQSKECATCKSLEEIKDLSKIIYVEDIKGRDFCLPCKEVDF